MKNMRKLIPALCLLLVSAMMLGTSTFAWFSMNNKVTVTGMEVKTKVSSSLWIAEDTITSTSKIADETQFVDELDETVQGLIEPASTSNGKTFFYTVDALKNGKKKQTVGSEAFIQYSSSASPIGSDAALYNDLFSQTYGVTKSSAVDYYGEQYALPYVDYVFQLKASVTTDSTQYINLTKLDLAYTGVEDASNAFRVAVFVEDITSGTATADAGTLVGTWAPAGALNWGDDSGSGEKVVSGTAEYADKNYVGSATPLATISTPAAGDHYYKVVVRLWIEGQDKSCTNDDFALLNDAWTLTLELKLEDISSTGVTELNLITR